MTDSRVIPFGMICSVINNKCIYNTFIIYINMFYLSSQSEVLILLSRLHYFKQEADKYVIIKIYNYAIN